jgi:DNA phosphorothioation-dependent restriction protein DptH
VFIPTSLRTSAEDSFGVATFEELTFVSLYEDLVQSLLERVPSTLLGPVRELLGFLTREEGWPYADDVCPRSLPAERACERNRWRDPGGQSV